ncbi:hypothetical protein [Rhodopirellula baltica]|uniref:Uncharacterized protein n=1 Tax=Rhodopirellula baltica SWK14 TaxID=993516 RepID=L7CFL3_RHOBT|nr:hypothetical protein [Rhodopirellula baltica]ELP32392.1 hypothetical protein RBSWK_03696 [Rhodopirellula baltica SWK14]
MNPNPYHSSNTQQASVQQLRSVRAWIVGSVFATVSAFAPLHSGVHLLGQEFGLFPVPYGVFDIEINGNPVSNRSFMWSSLLAGGVLVGIALACILRAHRNHNHNTSVRAAGSETIGEAAKSKQAVRNAMVKGHSTTSASGPDAGAR